MLRTMPGALVTGAGGGLGLAIAKRLAGRGYDVTLADVDGDAVEREVAGLGERAHSLRLDVTDLQASRAAAEGVAERAGSLDVWVNNAGILITGRTYEQELEAHRRMLEVNAIGTYNGTIAAIELMRGPGRGHVINVVSLAGLAAAPGIGGYAASKHAAIAFSLSTLADLRHAGIDDIHISCVCPDGVWTPMIQDRLDDPHDALSYSGKMLMPDEVAARVERLLDRPKPVVTIPRWRGRFVRFFDSHPAMAIRLTPVLMKDALRRQARFRQKVAKGKWPPR
jgi:NAD(P)-dependent dehydrogenase (short-subunit alcohol dehydrogenase family)